MLLGGRECLTRRRYDALDSSLADGPVLVDVLAQAYRLFDCVRRQRRCPMPQVDDLQLRRVRPDIEYAEAGAGYRAARCARHRDDARVLFIGPENHGNPVRTEQCFGKAGSVYPVPRRTNALAGRPLRLSGFVAGCSWASRSRTMPMPARLSPASSRSPMRRSRSRSRRCSGGCRRRCASGSSRPRASYSAQVLHAHPDQLGGHRDAVHAARRVAVRPASPMTSFLATFSDRLLPQHATGAIYKSIAHATDPTADLWPTRSIRENRSDGGGDDADAHRPVP